MGFAVDADSLGAEACERRDDRTNRELRFVTVNFSGRLKVNTFARALAGGNGQAKAFGCGLLLVRPVG